MLRLHLRRRLSSSSPFLRLPRSRCFSQVQLAQPLEHRQEDALDAFKATRACSLSQIAEYRSLAELRPLLCSMLEAGQVTLATTLLQHLQQRRPVEYRQLMTGDLVNRMIEAQLKVGAVEEAQSWTDRHQQLSDALTIALWLGYWVDRGNRRQVEAWLERMAPLKPPLIMATGYLSLRQLAHLRSFDARWEWTPESLPSVLNLAGLFAANEQDEGITAKDEGVCKGQEEDCKGEDGNGESDEGGVRQMNTKLGGAELIKDSLHALRLPVDPLIVQERLERDCYRASQERLERSLELYRAATKTGDLGPLIPWISRWHQTLVGEYQRLFAESRPDQRGSEQSDNARSPPVTPYFGGEERQANCHAMYASLLAPLPRETIALIVIQELTRVPSSPTVDDASLAGIPLCRMALSIGQALERELFAQQISQKRFLSHVHQTSHFTLQSALKDPRQLDAGLMVKVSRELEQNVEAVKAGWIPAWTPTLRAEVGVYLVHAALTHLQIEDQLRQ